MPETPGSKALFVVFLTRGRVFISKQSVGEKTIMEMNIVRIPKVDITFEAVLAHLHIGDDSEFVEEIAALHGRAVEIARPIAVYRPFTPQEDERGVLIGGVCIEEDFVRQMLAGKGTVVPYVASCGKEIDAFSKTFSDMFLQFAADAIKQLCLNAIRVELFKEVGAKFFDPDMSISTINPGSLKEWPITGQAALFEILDGAPGSIGVALTESMLMIPNKSVSGIIFQTQEEYHNCQLCPRVDCPGRRVPYRGE